MKNNDITPLIKFIESNSGEEITEESVERLNLSIPDNIIIKEFYYIIQQTNAAFERRFWKNDLEIIEIFLFKVKSNWTWAFRRTNIFDNNRFGDIRKMLCDYSGIPCTVKPIRPNQNTYLIVSR